MVSRHGTHFGTFTVEQYEQNHGLAPGDLGIIMKMSFWPNPRAGTGEFALIQIARSKRKDPESGWALYDTGGHERKYGGVVGDAWVDSSGSDCPAFGVYQRGGSGYNRLRDTFVRRDDTGTTGGHASGQIGFWDEMQKLPARLLDKPSRTADAEFWHRFESVVIVTQGPAAGRCFGALRWGYHGRPATSDPPGRPWLTLDEIVCASEPSKRWTDAVDDWNERRNTVPIPLRLI